VGVLKRTLTEYKDDNLTDWAAALTYYAVLSVFPGLIVLVSLLGLIGQDPQMTNRLLDIVAQIGPDEAVALFRSTIQSLVSNKAGAGALLGFGTLGALWAASGYIGAFMRVSNLIYEMEHERPFWRKRPLQIVITIVMVLGLAIVSVAIVVTGPLSEAVGRAIGLESVAVTIWDYAKWPVLVLLVMVMVSVLYYVAPNVKQPSWRLVTPGSVLAVVLWIAASLAFGFYVSQFATYNATYGSLAGVIVFLLWLYISNNALLLGAELNAEIERGRELKQGLPAEEDIQLPPRATKA